MVEDSSNGITAVSEDAVYEWSNALTGESINDKSPSFYLPPVELQRLAERLKHGRGNLYGLIGLQGTGKTSAAKYLEASSDETRYVKIDSGGTLLSSLERSYDDRFARELANRIYDELQNMCYDGQFESRLAKAHNKLVRIAGAEKQSSAIRWLLQRKDPPEKLDEAWLLPFLNQEQIRTIREEMLLSFLCELSTLVIDPPDYPSKDKRALSRDLDDVQDLWARLDGYGKAPNIVVTIQKELFMAPSGVTHYLLGKMDVTELRHLKSEQLLEIYQKTFRVCDPFTQEALLWVARVSGGVCRRFKKYVRLSLEQWLITEPRPPQIDLVLAKSAVSPETIADGVMAEVEAIFPKGESKEKARRLLAHLYHSGEPLNQKQLAEQLSLNEMDVGRIVTRLEPYGYFTRSTTKDGKFIQASM